MLNAIADASNVITATAQRALALGAAGFVVACLAIGQPAAGAPPEVDGTPASATPLPAAAAPGSRSGPLGMVDFLDRLMMAESGGRQDARNPRSTAVGPYQFIERTWLELARRVFTAETAGMTPAQILALRTDRGFARRGAEVYTMENAAILKSRGLEATFPRLRLAFLLGPEGATRVLRAQPTTRVTAILGPAVANANPFMYGLTVEGLVARAARDLEIAPSSMAGMAAGDRPQRPGATKGTQTARAMVRCNLALPACRRWQSLAVARVIPGGGGRKQVAAVKGR